MRKLIAAIVFLFLGCTPEYKPKHAVGKPTEIIVISEPEVYSEVESLLVQSLERVIYTPTTEHIFNIKKAPPGELPEFKYRKNCLILGLIGDEIIDSILAPSSMQELLIGKSYLFGGPDLFVEQQSVLVVAAPTTYKLKEVVKVNSELIFNYFAEGVRKSVEETLYEEGYQESLSRKLVSKYGFSIKVPKNWVVARDEFGYIEFFHPCPDRIISIYWEDTPRIKLDKDKAISIRDKIGARYYEGDYVEESLTNFYWVKLHDVIAAKLDGIWQNDEKVTGGPFRSYFFWSGGRLYVIDAHVFAPGEKKWHWLQQLEGICATFSFRGKGGHSRSKSPRG